LPVRYSEKITETIADLGESLIRLLNSIGTFRTEEKRSSIHVVRGQAFVGIDPKKS